MGHGPVQRAYRQHGEWTDSAIYNWISPDTGPVWFVNWQSNELIERLFEALYFRKFT